MSLTTKVLIALVAGLAGGLVISASGVPSLMRVAEIIAPLGTLFINAIRMTIIPLVVGSLIAGVASVPSARSLGRLGVRALIFFLATLVLGGTLTALVAPPLFSWLPVNAAASESLRAAAAGSTTASATAVPSVAQWLVDLVPSNPLRAASDAAMLPLIVFSVAFGLALSSLALAQRHAVISVFQALRDASLTLVRWILVTAPVGVFALALALAARLGTAAAGAIAGYVVVVSVLTVAFTLVVLYPLASTLGGVPLMEFARAVLPAQAVAFSSRSSLATLPAAIDIARTRLRLPEEMPTFFLPLAASVYRVGAGVGLTVGVLFIARLYGVELTVAQLATVVLTVVLTSFSAPGIPGGSIIIMTPVLMSVGLPVDGIGILLGVDTLPDMVRTTANVTGHLAAATALSRGRRAPTPAPPAAAESR